MRFEKILFMFLFVALTSLNSQPVYRKEIKIPDILGYKTLKCDFHMHTVFSDGAVWPTFRVEEAWREGLDAIAITDHLEYQPKKDFVPTNHNNSYNIANDLAKDFGITLIQGSEITRSMPPGHLNAIFITDANELIKDDFKDVAKEVQRQGGIIFWNHPGWKSQQPDGIPKWYDEHSFLLEKKILVGIEVVNSIEYYPKVLEWCLDKKLAVLGNSDTHDPIMFEYDFDKTDKRPMTLVFATSNSPEAIKDALLNQRTAAFTDGKLYGEEKYLKSIFNKSVTFKSKNVNATGRGTVNLQIVNKSDINYTLELAAENDEIRFPEKIELYAGATVIFSVRAKKDDARINKIIKAEYNVKNLTIAPDKNLKVSFDLAADIKPKKK
jgi:hypothetical protein